MKYQKNYLTRVIFQLRFDPVLVLESTQPADFQSKIRSRFPRGAKEAQDFEIETSLSANRSFKAELRNVRKRWTFLSEDDARMLTVAANEFTIQYTKYKDSDQLKSDFTFLWEEFQQIYHVQPLERVGLRYINEISLATGNPLSWDGYIDQKLLAAILGFPSPEGHALSRSFHEIRWGGDDHRLAFRFGIHNSDYPNPVAKREFILDYDCFSSGPVDAAYALDLLAVYNRLIENLFEQSIDDHLRRDMGILEAKETILREENG